MSMYIRFKEFSPEAVDRLTAISNEVNYKDAYSHRRRVGERGAANLSVYRYSRWYDWTKAQREAYKADHLQDAINNAVVGWFLDIPAGTGFLDRMTAWVGKPMSGTVIAIVCKTTNVSC